MILLDTTRRHREPEVMDDPQIDECSHQKALRGLARINRWSGSTRIVWRPIRDLARSQQRTIRVLDVAAGAGDVVIGLWRRAQRAGLSVAIEGCDVSEQAVTYARQRVRDAGVDVRFFQLDVLSQPLPREYDVIMTSLFLHHLTDEQAVHFLRAAAGAAKCLVLVNDLVRSRRGLFLAYLGTHILSRSRVVHIDGPRSVRAAYTIDEVKALAGDAGLERRDGMPQVALPIFADVEENMITSPLSLMQLAERTWDAVVIGAGPGGAMAAHELARRGMAVLLVDKATFPRSKVCGCCLSAAAMAELEDSGLGDLVEELGAVDLHELRLCVAGGYARIKLPRSSMALSRERLDAGLVERAVRSGAIFVDGTVARLDGAQLSIRRGSDSCILDARVIIAADGLSGTSLQNATSYKKQAAHYSRIGANAIVRDAPAFYETGAIVMACARGGYVGLVRLEDGRLDIAAALDAAFVRDMHGPGEAIANILKGSDLPPIENTSRADWQGTPYLTRAPSRLAGPGLFVIGDAAGYIEPFTGEGIAWALASGRAVADIAEQAMSGWRAELADEWTRLHHELLARRQRVCRWITLGLREPMLTRLAVRALTYWPRLNEPLIGYIHRPFGQCDTQRGKPICQPA